MKMSDARRIVLVLAFLQVKVGKTGEEGSTIMTRQRGNWNSRKQDKNMLR